MWWTPSPLAFIKEKKRKKRIRAENANTVKDLKTMLKRDGITPSYIFLESWSMVKEYNKNRWSSRRKIWRRFESLGSKGKSGQQERRGKFIEEKKRRVWQLKGLDSQAASPKPATSQISTWLRFGCHFLDPDSHHDTTQGSVKVIMMTISSLLQSSPQ